jgi:hypothetical protein
MVSLLSSIKEQFDLDIQYLFVQFFCSFTYNSCCQSFFERFYLINKEVEAIMKTKLLISIYCSFHTLDELRLNNFDKNDKLIFNLVQTNKSSISLMINQCKFNLILHFYVS